MHLRETLRATALAIGDMLWDCTPMIFHTSGGRATLLVAAPFPVEGELHRAGETPVQKDSLFALLAFWDRS